MKSFLLSLFFLPFHCLFAQNDTLQTQKDSVFTISGDTLIGKITVDKDNNQYLFKDSLVLLPTKIKGFIISRNKTMKKYTFIKLFLTNFIV